MKKIIFAFSAMLLFTIGSVAQSKKPNILIIWGDDIG